MIPRVLTEPSSRSLMPTSQPAAAKARAMPRPMRRLPPVTKAFLPLRSCGESMGFSERVRAVTLKWRHSIAILSRSANHALSSAITLI